MQKTNPIYDFGKALLKHINLIFISFFFVALVSCEKTPRNSPWDSSVNIAHWSPENLAYTINSAKSVTLHWEYNNSILPEGFAIHKKTNTDYWHENYILLTKDCLSFTDQEINLTKNNYTFQLYAFAGERKTIPIEVFIPKKNSK